MPKLPKYINSQFYERIDNLRKNKRYQCDTPLRSRTSAYNRFFRHHPDEVPDDRIRRNELHPEAGNVDQMARDSEEK